MNSRQINKGIAIRSPVPFGDATGLLILKIWQNLNSI